MLTIVDTVSVPSMMQTHRFWLLARCSMEYLSAPFR